MQQDQILVVDLDETLIRTDLLHETLWSALGGGRFRPGAAAGALMQGRAALKAYLAQHGRVEFSTLPYDDAVIGHIREWRAGGGRVALVTAADQTLAEGVAAHTGLFDEVYGSAGGANLKGARKAAFLVERFGAQGFVYMGDSRADLAVWQKAAGAVTVNASPRLRARVAALGGTVEHLGNGAQPFGAASRLLRPHQWLKNTLVFLPMLSAHQFAALTFAQSLLAFVAFCLVASSVYVLNDLLDLGADRAHPRKRNRPLASGALSARQGSLILPVVLGAGLGVAAGGGSGLFWVMLGYFVATTAYSLGLKYRTVADVCLLAGFYTLRIVAGGLATGIELSVWLLAFSMFFFLSLAAVKRQAELVDGIAHGRYSIPRRGYRADDLPIVTGMAIASGYASVLVLALYIDSPIVRQSYSSPYALWGVCLVLLYWISRVVMITHRGRMTDDPMVFAVTDRTSQACLALCLGFVLAGALL